LGVEQIKKPFVSKDERISSVVPPLFRIPLTNIIYLIACDTQQITAATGLH